MILTNKSISGNNVGWELIDGHTVVDDEAEVTFTGLHGDKDGVYKVIYICHNSNTAFQRLRVNDDDGANYDFVQVTIGSSTVDVETVSNNTDLLLSSASILFAYCIASF